MTFFGLRGNVVNDRLRGSTISEHKNDKFVAIAVGKVHCPFKHTLATVKDSVQLIKESRRGAPKKPAGKFACFVLRFDEKAKRHVYEPLHDPISKGASVRLDPLVAQVENSKAAGTVRNGVWIDPSRINIDFLTVIDGDAKDAKVLQSMKTGPVFVPEAGLNLSAIETEGYRCVDEDDSAVQQWHHDRGLELRREILSKWGVFTSNDVAERVGSSATNRASLANRWKTERRIFAVKQNGNDVFPKFQFDPQTGQPLRVMHAIISQFGEVDGWRIAIWITSPNGFLGARRPVDFLLKDPDKVVEAVGAELVHVGT